MKKGDDANTAFCAGATVPAIKRAARTDCDLVVQMFREFCAERGEHCEMTDDFASYMIRDPAFGIYLAVSGSEPIGILCAQEFADVWDSAILARVELLFVRQNVRGSGVVRKLFVALDEFAKGCGARLLEWEISDSDDALAEQYERLGASRQPIILFRQSVDE